MTSVTASDGDRGGAGARRGHDHGERRGGGNDERRGVGLAGPKIPIQNRAKIEFFSWDLGD